MLEEREGKGKGERRRRERKGGGERRKRRGREEGERMRREWKGVLDLLCDNILFGCLGMLL